MTANHSSQTGAFEQGWGRKSPLLELSAGDVARLLAPLARGRLIESYAPLSGGLANSNFSVQIAGQRQPVVLRIFTREHDARAQEGALLQLVRGRVPVPELLFSAELDEQIGHPYAVLSFVDGVLLGDLVRGEAPAAVLAAAESVGETLAAIGSFAMPRAGFFAPDLTVQPYVEDPEGSMADFAARYLYERGAATVLGPELSRQVLRTVQEAAPSLPSWTGPAVLVHADYKAGNIIMRPEGDGWIVAGVLDWEFSFAGSPLFDFGPLLRYGHLLPAEFEQGVEEGYRRGGGTLPPGWRRTVQVLDFVNLLDFLVSPARNASLIAGVLELIRRTVAEA